MENRGCSWFCEHFHEKSANFPLKSAHFRKCLFRSTPMRRTLQIRWFSERMLYFWNFSEKSRFFSFFEGYTLEKIAGPNSSRRPDYFSQIRSKIFVGKYLSANIFKYFWNKFGQIFHGKYMVHNIGENIREFSSRPRWIFDGTCSARVPPCQNVEKSRFGRL